MGKNIEAETLPLEVMAREEQIVQLIIFDLGNEEFGARIDDVKEIVKVGAITPIPDSPDFIKGMANLRGDIVLAIDLKARFNLSSKEDDMKHMIIRAQDKNLFGLMVDEVTEVLRIPGTEIKPRPNFITKIEKRYINGVLTLGDRLVILLDLVKILSEEEMARLSEMRIATAEAQKLQPQRTRKSNPEGAGSAPVKARKGNAEAEAEEEPFAASAKPSAGFVAAKTKKAKKEKK